MVLFIETQNVRVIRKKQKVGSSVVGLAVPLASRFLDKGVHSEEAP